MFIWPRGQSCGTLGKGTTVNAISGRLRDIITSMSQPPQAR
jgi:hypothetical protein